MAANVAVTYTFVNGTSADGTQVNQDFTDLVSWINTNAVHLDGSKAFTGAPTYAADPVSDNQLCRKAYLDAMVPQTVFKEVKLRRAAAQSIAGDGADYAISWDTEDADASGFIAAPGTTLTVPSGADGLYVIGMLTTWPAGRTDRSTLRVNGADLSPSNSDYVPNGNANPSRNGWVVYLQAGDTLQFLQAQISGGALNITASLSMVRVSD